MSQPAMQIIDNPNALVSDGQIHGKSPYDGTPLPTIPASTHNDVNAAITRARNAQVKWASLTPYERVKKLLPLKDALLQDAERLADLMHTEQGKSPAESITSEILPCGDLFTYWCKHGPRLLIPTKQRLNPINFPHKQGTMTLAPKGVVGLISPWNYPLVIPMRTLIPALIAGNTVVFKPSEYAARVGVWIGELFARAGEDLVCVVSGAGDIGQHLVESPIDHVVFTGSVNTGQQIAKQCAEHFTSASLELGGKDAAIVCQDADMDRAAAGIVWGAFANAGQNCASVERVLVVEDVYESFVKRVLEHTQRLTLGADSSQYDVGPMVRAQGLETVREHVQDAVRGGATVRCGGQARGPGQHWEPTVLTDVDMDMAVMNHETFGPVLPIVKVRDEQEAIKLTNASVFGLTTSVWTRDINRGEQLATQLKSGVVTVNNHAFTAAIPHAPWTGTGQSGGGVTNSPFAFYDLVHPRYVLVDRARKPELWWFPHNGALTRIANNLAKLLAGPGRLAALWAVISTMPKRWKRD